MSTNTSSRIAAGVTAAYLRDIARPAEPTTPRRVVSSRLAERGLSRSCGPAPRRRRGDDT